MARELFLKQGMERTSLQEIADRIGVTKPALYYHFASREDLVRSIIEPLIADGDAFVLAAEHDRLHPRELLRRYFALHYHHREVVALMVRELTALHDLGLVERVLGWRHRLAHLLVGPHLTFDGAVRAVVALGGLADTVMAFPDAPRDELCDAAVDAAMGALGL
ncbi:helix-turn-helix domain-containing protein [Saccharothrix sp. CCNWLY140]|uniref:TetR/AcrR family transcriptional regulator n=1 Tax=unclassified Saccharothrix TaxID=2593673 RepID=UPI00307D7D6B